MMTHELPNARKAEIYDRAHNRLMLGWTKRSLVDAHGVCLVGAIQYAAPLTSENKVIQVDLANALLGKSAYARHLAYQAASRIPVWSGHIGDHPASGDGGIAFIEKWNDARWRRKRRVLALLAERRDHFKALAKDDRINELTVENERLLRQLSELTQRLEELEIEVGMLKEESNFWKGRALGKREDEFVRVLREAGEINETVTQNSAELFELRRPL